MWDMPSTTKGTDTRFKTTLKITTQVTTYLNLTHTLNLILTLNQNPTLHPIPDLTNMCVDRAEHSKRQDWSLEAAYDIFPLVDPLLNYTGEAQGKGLLGGVETYRIQFYPLPSH